MCSVLMCQKGVVISGSNASIAPLVLMFNVVVLRRQSFNDSWSITLGLCADAALAVVAEVLPSVDHVAWLSGPIKKVLAGE